MLENARFQLPLGAGTPRLRAAKLEDQVAELAEQLQVATGRASEARVGDVTERQELETRVADLAPRCDTSIIACISYLR